MYLACLFFAAACSENKVANESTTTNTDTSFSVDGKKVIVYTTADSTDYRLSPIDTLSFADFDQPLETQPSIFIDPSHTFQTFLGVGGALTDAAAETFAKLSPDKQKEVLQAYYDKDKGIGYTIGRTNINSCDFSSDMYTYVTDGDREFKIIQPGTRRKV
jgi:glucosylceramidase